MLVWLNITSDINGPGSSSSAVVYFNDTFPSKSPILIIMYHPELTPESYKLKEIDFGYGT